MKDNKENKTNAMSQAEGYNVCPTCGRDAHTILTEDGTYRVGCMYCGLRNGVSTFIEGELTNEDAELMRKCWNKRVVNSFIHEDVRELLRLKTGGLAIVSNRDGVIVDTAETIKDVISFLDLVGDDISYGVYLHIDGSLQEIGCTYLVERILNEYGITN